MFLCRLLGDGCSLLPDLLRVVAQTTPTAETRRAIQSLPSRSTGPLPAKPAVSVDREAHRHRTTYRDGHLTVGPSRPRQTLDGGDSPRLSHMG